MSVFMGITVESVSWDRFLGRLRVHGVICHAPEIISSGHHTINISLRQPLTIVKKEWPTHLLDRLKAATETEKPLLILSIDDEGFAIAETKQYGVEVKIEQRMKLPGKRESNKRSSALKEYFDHVIDELKAAKGSVVNVTSIAGTRVHPFAGSAYSTSKAALAANPRGVPFLIVRGRMGGSAMTAAAVNALARAGL